MKQTNKSQIKDFSIKILELWRRIYCQLIPLVVTTVYIIFYSIIRINVDDTINSNINLNVWESAHFNDTLTSIITFVSIIISLLGVMLTLLISAKEQSNLINYFLQTADKEVFVKSLKKIIICGLVIVINCTVLFLFDILSDSILFFLTVLGIYLLFRFTTLTYRFTNILLMLFILEKNPEKRKGQTMKKEEIKELNDKIKDSRNNG